MGLPDTDTEARTELIRKLGSSRFNYWFGYVANLSLVVWLVRHAFVDGSVGGSAAAHGARLGTLELFAFAATGLLAWTLAEWLLHRYAYHLWTSFLTEGHGLHHEDPRALIGVPWYLTAIALVLAFELLAIPLRPSSTGIVMGFAWLGYVFYCITHHGSHHWRLPRGWLRMMKRHHLLHHAHPEYNWGFTTPLWDHVFGTHYDRARRAGTPMRSAPSG
jgi:sterol desaturase/sphingolipid hydroxylase (fatty acid hydroxylase superfamily)